MPPATAGDPSALLLQALAEVDSQGIFLDQLVDPSLAATVPHLRLAPAPALGQIVTLTRGQVIDSWKKAAPETVTTNWDGAARIQITRRSRMLNESELKEQLTAALVRDCVKDPGELELRLNRPWTPVRIPDEPYLVKIQDLPTSGLSANFIVRFELANGAERLGGWQLAVQAKLFRAVYVTSAPVRRGQLLKDLELVTERRDVLAQRELLWNLPTDTEALEVTENLNLGAPLLGRMLRPHPVVQRGKIMQALVQDGALNITLRVEVLEDGLPGQTVRVRNAQTRREFFGKVQNEQTILVAF